MVSHRSVVAKRVDRDLLVEAITRPRIDRRSLLRSAAVRTSDCRDHRVDSHRLLHKTDNAGNANDATAIAAMLVVRSPGPRPQDPDRVKGSRPSRDLASFATREDERGMIRDYFDCPSRPSRGLASLATQYIAARRALGKLANRGLCQTRCRGLRATSHRLLRSIIHHPPHTVWRKQRDSSRSSRGLASIAA